MICRSARKLLPLAAGGDLPERRAGKVAAHLETCGGCRAELDAYRSALDRARELDGAVDRSWKDAAWMTAVRRAVSQSGRLAAPRSKPLFRPAVFVVAGAILIAVAALVLFLTRNPLRLREIPGAQLELEGAKHDIPATVAKKSEPAHAPTHPTILNRDIKKKFGALTPAAGKIKPSPAPTDKAHAGAAASVPPAQEIVSATFISQETGLKVVWFFNRNFDWKGEEK